MLWGILLIFGRFCAHGVGYKTRARWDVLNIFQTKHSSSNLAKVLRKVPVLLHTKDSGLPNSIPMRGRSKAFGVYCTIRKGGQQLLCSGSRLINVGKCCPHPSDKIFLSDPLKMDR